MPVRRGTRLRLGRPDGGVQAGWQTSSGRLAVAGGGWFGCETADVAAERVPPLGARRQHDSRHCQQEHGHLRPEAWLTLRLGRQATGGATSAAREFQRGRSSTLRFAGSVPRAAGHSDGEGATARASHSPQPHCLVPVRRGTWLRLGGPAGGVQAGGQTSDNKATANDWPLSQPHPRGSAHLAAPQPPWAPGHSRSRSRSGSTPCRPCPTGRR